MIGPMKKPTYYLVVAASCVECGPKYAIELFRAEPTDEQRNKIGSMIGDMDCIRTAVVPTTERELEGILDLTEDIGLQLPGNTPLGLMNDINLQPPNN
jgi:hypothetical protein